MFRKVAQRKMRKIAKYGLILLGVLIWSPQLTIGQEVERLKSLKELRQLERGVAELEEIDPVRVYVLPELPVTPFFNYKGTTSLKIMKKLNNVTNYKKFTFNIEEGYSDINIMIISELKEGHLKISLRKPDQKLIKEFKLGPGQNQSWNQSYCLEEYAGQGFTGKWFVELSCSDATGYYQFVSSSR